jgi:Protein of unknown function (DUF3662)/Inner membrane component of T3SS, cytoplasmic domain
MRFLAALERRLERAFERPAARLFATPIQPVQLQHRLERALEVERVTSGGRVYAPDEYSVHLHPADLEVIREDAPDLERQLAEALVARARDRGYFMRASPMVRIVGDAETPRGEAHVGAVVTGADDGLDGTGPPVEATAVYRAPAVATPLAELVVREPAAGSRRVRLDGPLVRIGRGGENQVILADPKVSRHHGELRVRRGTLIYRDLGSTNGSLVNGTRITEMAVGLGDRIEVGDTTIVVESAS